MITIKSSGSYKNTYDFLNRIIQGSIFSDLDHYGRVGVDALSNATPIESGETAQSWRYKVVRSKTHTGIQWYNNHVVDGSNIAVLIQYGHGTGTGGYVTGRDYINPAIRPVFDSIADAVWKKVTS